MKNLFFLFILLAVSMLTSCSPSVKITGSWMDPKAKSSGKRFQKVFLFAITDNINARTTIENDLANAATKEGINVVKSYEVMTPSFLKSQPTEGMLIQKIKEAGCDGVFTVALVDAKSETRYVPGTTTYAPYPAYGYYGTFGGYYGYHGAYVYDPGYYVNDKTYYIESNLYDLATGELIWSV